MKKAQLIGVGIAAVCGLGAFIVMKKFVQPPKVVKQDVQVNTTEVLVAKQDLGLGHIANEASFRWQSWPADAVPPGAISRRPGGSGNQMGEFRGAVARAPVLAGEPITKTKLVKSGEGGILAAVLPQGYRAISTKISEESAVGRLILPNDHVDVILIRRLRSAKGAEEHVSDTLFKNVRILAIGQRIEVKEGQKNADGNTATLQLTPRQAELLALAKSMGEISLALRSVADFEKEGQGQQEADLLKNGQQRGNAIKVLRYGVKSRAYGVN
jgi:pilus assembly protein CpaB